MLRQMWEKLDAFTVYANTANERPINVRNEWGGYSRRIGMSVFTGWQDHRSPRDGGFRVLVCDQTWSSISGVNNQDYWVRHAIENGGEAAFFVIKAVDPSMTPRTVEWLDDSRVFCGRVCREAEKSYVDAERVVAL